MAIGGGTGWAAWAYPPTFISGGIAHLLNCESCLRSCIRT